MELISGENIVTGKPLSTADKVLALKPVSFSLPYEPQQLDPTIKRTYNIKVKRKI
jgi:hypothetical protein